ncbi:hypothetical protein Tco_0396630 [Tanacetum coccineum]
MTSLMASDVTKTHVEIFVIIFLMMSRQSINTSYIDATIAGKPVTISEASIRSDLLFDDANGIDSLNNQAIFDNIKLLGFFKEDTPLFDLMLVQQTEDEGEASERSSDSQPIPSPHPKGSWGDSIKAQAKKLKKGVKPLITHHKAWMQTRLARKTSLKKKGVHNEYVSKQGRKSVISFYGKTPFLRIKKSSFDDLDDIINPKDRRQKRGLMRRMNMLLNLKAEEEKIRSAKEEPTKAALTNEYVISSGRINADMILPEELQNEERE